MKRFYSAVTVESGQILLDEKPVKTPSGANLVAPNDKLAAAIVSEWEAQEDELNPAAMPLTQLLNTQIDKIGVNRSPIIDGIMSYAETDPVCYYAEEPEDLRARQKEVWGRLTDWLSDEYDIELVVTFGVAAAAQSGETLVKLRDIVEDLSDSHLTALQAAVGITTSLVISLALVKGKICPSQAHEAALLEELYQADRWGNDDEAETRREGIKKELENVYGYCTL